MSTNKCDFSTAHYREILEAGLKNGYKFVSFEEIGSVPASQKACTIRHDVDYMPEWAIHFGDIEKSLGIKSTFFFQVCAKPYNLREAGNYEVVQKLAAMGHRLGLHFDLTWKKDMEWKDVAKYCEKDKRIFKVITDIEPCELISFHNPHRFVDLILNQDIQGMRHTYEKRFFSDIKYLSDSQGWYEGCMCKIFESGKYPRIQFLTHPYIWPEEDSGDFISNMARIVRYRAHELTQYMIDYNPVCRKHQERLKSEVR